MPDELDAEELYHIGRAYAQFTGAKEVVVARDMRPSGDAFEPELVRGLTEAGVNVIRIGLATSPLFYFAVHHFKAEGGVMVTASHNPGNYNGVKVTLAEAKPVSGDTGLYDIRDLVEQRQWAAGAEPGVVREDDSARAAYLNAVIEDGLAEGLKIVVDTGNGMVGSLMAEVAQRMGGEIIPLYWELDGTFPNHEADPLKDENMADLHAAVKKHGADLGVAFDGDGDRVFFCTEQGVTIPGDITTAVIAQAVLAKRPGWPIIYDLRASRTTAEAITEAGGEPVMWKVGHSLIKPKMRELEAPFAGEVSGHYFFAPWYAESALLAMNHFLRVLKESDGSASELVAPLLRRAKTAEINFEVSDKAAVLRRLREAFSDAELVDFDGIRFDYPSWWASVRPSNTEPKLRLNMEADTPELLAEKQAEVEGIIKSIPSSP